jgi:L-fuculokinase
MPHIAILDIGKTNKKYFVFDEDYQVVLEQTEALPETTDEEGDPCEDLALLTNWILKSTRDILGDKRFHITAINCTTYGASWVHIDAEGKPLTPLYNYLKPFPDDLKKQFYETYGSAQKMALETASPVLGHLNSGMQLYWLKHRQPLVFNQIKWSLHLPQYVSMVIRAAMPKSGGDLESPPDYAASEMTSIGCHTMLWHFQQNDYHHWVKQEGIADKFPPVRPGNTTTPRPQSAKSPAIQTGIGLHDSSSALIPYFTAFKEPFVLISTGTWCISLNPFNDSPLTPEELAQDCLCYLSDEGNPVKAARYFGGNEHEEMVKLLAKAFHKPIDFYKTITFDYSILERLHEAKKARKSGWDPTEDYETGYYEIMKRIVDKQYRSTKLVLTEKTSRIFVDGGFSKNECYMQLLAKHFPKMEVYSAEVAQATALGAALAVHPSWNEKPTPDHLISLKKI